MNNIFRLKLLFALYLFVTPQLCFAQNTTIDIPVNTRNEILMVFMNTYYDSNVNEESRKKPSLSENELSYEYNYDGSLGEEFVGTLIIPKKFLLGDLNGDGRNEMVIISEANYGGNSSFGQIFIFSKKNNSWALSAHNENKDVLIKDQHLANGMLYGTIVAYAPDDAHCCPSLRTKIWYKYDPNKNEIVEVERKPFKSNH